MPQSGGYARGWKMEYGRWEMEYGRWGIPQSGGYARGWNLDRRDNIPLFYYR